MELNPSLLLNYDQREEAKNLASDLDLGDIRAVMAFGMKQITQAQNTFRLIIALGSTEDNLNLLRQDFLSLMILMSAYEIKIKEVGDATPTGLTMFLSRRAALGVLLNGMLTYMSQVGF